MFFAVSAFMLAALPTALFLRNFFLFAHPPMRARRLSRTSVSLLIPARNEERSIGASLNAALASEEVDLEVIVLDDGSDDRTAEIVREYMVRDARVHLHTVPAPPPGWCGKQFACSVLATLASHDTLCFCDADVRLAPQGIHRMLAFLDQSGAALVSGFPFQETGTIAEKMCIPLIHFLLLGFLPIWAMRRTSDPAFAAGCGQLILARRDEYEQAGGHAAIRDSRHDGITLPKAFRRAGLMTDLCDATTVASCRMYRNAGEVFNGLLKNATEGIATPVRIVPFTILLVGGQVLPIILLLAALHQGQNNSVMAVARLATAMSYLPRMLAALRFGSP